MRCKVLGNGDLAKHFEVWKGRHPPPTGPVSDAVKVEAYRNTLGLNQPASQVSQSWPAATAAGPLAVDGGGVGAGTDAQVIELARKISAVVYQIEQLEQRNGILDGSICTPNSNFASAMGHLKQCASSFPQAIHLISSKLARPS